MCTVSFVRLKDAVVITSNRDEHIQRENATAPAFYFLKNTKAIFPKDAKAGGTWFAAAENGVVAVLLNGALVKHVTNPPYRRSRGLILLDIIEAEDPLNFFKEVDLLQIEPFTIVLYLPDCLYELRWDGKTKYDTALDSTGNYIWSSATLYSENIIQHRKNLFELFIQDTNPASADTIRDFHSYNQGDDENGFVISRNTGMKTFSITQAIIKPGKIDFLHTDLLLNQQFEESLHIHQTSINI